MDDVRKLTWNDTIIALSTPPGLGALGVLRLSGPNAIQLAEPFFPSKSLVGVKGGTLHLGELVFNGVILDQVLLSVFRAPHSYTGENVVEISCHGSPYIEQQIMEAFLSAGARLANRGEFTQRAYLNGKLDLTQAEAVADLISSNSAYSRNVALRHMKGDFSRTIDGLRDKLIKFSSLIELELDFSEEDVVFADRSDLLNLLEDIREVTDRLLHSFKLGNVIKNGVQVAIVGAPNVGKSTLLNRLLHEERAIVSEIPGTTRDSIEAVLNINGILFNLVDTAGIRDETEDQIEKIGVERSRKIMQEADLILFLFDASCSGNEMVQAFLDNKNNRNIPFILVGNKVDLSNDTQRSAFLDLDPDVIFISAKNGTSISELEKKMFDLSVHGKLEMPDMIVTNSRHVDALKNILHCLDAIHKGISDQLSGDLLSLDIRECLYFLGLISGKVTNEEQLDYIFSKFCIGK